MRKEIDPEQIQTLLRKKVIQAIVNVKVPLDSLSEL
jgi:hypothetical protein